MSKKKLFLYHKRKINKIKHDSSNLILWLMCGLMVIIWIVGLYFINFNLEKHHYLLKNRKSFIWYL